MGEKFRNAKESTLNGLLRRLTLRPPHLEPRHLIRSEIPPVHSLTQILVIFITLGFSLAFVTNAPVILFIGACIGVLFQNPCLKLTKTCATFLLGVAVTCIGFKSDLSQVMTSLPEVFIVATMVAISLALGLYLGRRIGLPNRIALLIACGTAICGGSAIMAAGRTADATDEETAISLTTIFFFNAVGLIAVPYIAWVFDLDPNQAGLWAALAIHDTGSVIAAAMEFGPPALAYATVVKIFRALFLIPVVILIGLRFSKHAPGRNLFKLIPWFIPGFFIATILANHFSIFTEYTDVVANISKYSMLGALFLLGTSLTKENLSRLSLKPFALGALLWVPISAIALLIAIFKF